MKTPITFESQLRVNIRTTIRKQVQDGTTAMGLECLRQCTKTPSAELSGAPRGTNAQYYYAEMFRRVCDETRDIAAFIL